MGQRTQERDGYVALQLGAGTKKAKNTNKAQRGIFRQAGSGAQGLCHRVAASMRTAMMDVGSEFSG